MKNTIRYTTILIVLILLFIITAQSFAEAPKIEFAQSTVTQTAKPASPNGTPTPGSDVTTSNTSFTQADLSLLTGNIQRPNGLVWHDGKIYAACSGDWTVYQIDATTGNTNQYIYGVKNAHSMVAQTDGQNTDLWIPDFQSNNLVEITQGVVKNIATNLNGPWGIAQFNDTQFLVTNLRGNDVVMVGEGDPKEIIIKLRSPTGIVVDDK